MDGNDQIEEWVNAWKRASPVMQELRVKEMRDNDIGEVIISFNKLFENSIEDNPPKPWSGLVEQQRLFSKLR